MHPVSTSGLPGLGVLAHQEVPKPPGIHSTSPLNPAYLSHLRPRASSRSAWSGLAADAFGEFFLILNFTCYPSFQPTSWGLELLCAPLGGCGSSSDILGVGRWWVGVWQGGPPCHVVCWPGPTSKPEPACRSPV